jgi:hypothetical protein
MEDVLEQLNAVNAAEKTMKETAAAGTNAVNTATTEIFNKMGSLWIPSDTDFASSDPEPDEETEAEVKDPEGSHQVIDSDKTEPVKKISNDEAMNSAETMAGFLDLLITGVFGFWELSSYKKAFADQNWSEVKSILRQDRAALTPDKQMLYDRVLKSQAHFKARKDEIQLSQEEYDQKKKAFFHHYKSTGKGLNPNVVFYGNIILGFTERLTGKLMDDGY